MQEVTKNQLSSPITLQSGEAYSITAQLYRHLRGSIIRGDLVPGQALSESEIARQNSTSRQPVREAFIKLSEERLVSIVPQRGTFVVKISVADVLDARFVREAIEVAVVKEAIHVSSAVAIKELRALIERQKTVTLGQNEEFMAMDEEFHHTIALSIGRTHAWRVIENTKAQMDRIRYLSLDDATPLHLIIAQHARIVDGIEAGDATMAVAAMRSHLREITISLPTIAARFPDLFDAD